MTSTGRESKGTWAAAAMPSKRWRTTASESSAGKSSTRAGATDRELAQASGARSDAHRDIQSQEALAALGFAPQDADGLLRPEALDQPLGLRPGGGQLAGAFKGQEVHPMR